MASSDILSQLRKLSKRTYTLKYGCWNIGELSLYEHMYNLIRGKDKRPKTSKIIFQYLIQSVFGVYRTDYGVLKTDYFVQGSDILVGLLTSFQLLKNGNTVVFYGYNLFDYSVPTKLYSEKRYSAIPDESLKLICGEIGIEFNVGMGFSEVCAGLISKINELYNDRFIFLRNVNMTDFYRVKENETCSLIKNQSNDTGFFLSSNELIILDALVSGENANKDRRRGRVISMVKSNNVILISQKTKDTPRVNGANEICIADGHRQTQDVDNLYVKDRNKDIIEALAINEKIRYSNGISR